MIFGMFFESFAMILILSPVFVADRDQLRIEPHPFRAVMVYNLCIGMTRRPSPARCSSRRRSCSGRSGSLEAASSPPGSS